MLPSWKVKQLTAGCDDEQEEIVALPVMKKSSSPSSAATSVTAQAMT